MYIYPLSRRQYVYGMLIARTSNEFTKINEQEENSRCNARGYMRKGKGRPDITEVMFYPGYPSGSNSSFDSLSNLNVFLLIGWGRGGAGGAGGRGGGWQRVQL
jgi:hypothetical protein